MTEKILLPNQLPILYHQMLHSPTTTVLILVKVGSRYENKMQQGISHFLEHMMFKGTTHRPDSLSISIELDEIGADYNAFTGFEYTGYWVKVANQKTQIAVDVLADIFQNSLFQEKEISTERGAILEEMNMIADNPMRQVKYHYQELLYGDSSLGRPIIGTSESVQRFTRNDLKDYFFSKYSASNSLVVVSGGVQTDELDNIQHAFKDLRSQPSPTFEPVIHQTGKTFSHQYKDTDQVHLTAGIPTHGMLSEDRFVGEIIATVLGGYMSSRLFTEIREKRGLAYYAAARTQEHEDLGSLMLLSGVKIGKVSEVVEIMRDQTQYLADTLTIEEFTRAKEHIKASLAVAFETSDRIAMEIAFRELLMKESFDIELEMNKYDSVTFEDARNYIKKYLQSGQMYVATIGKISETELQTIQNIIAK
jgi:predicted Zn-dependent peptidase